MKSLSEDGGAREDGPYARAFYFVFLCLVSGLVSCQMLCCVVLSMARIELFYVLSCLCCVVHAKNCSCRIMEPFYVLSCLCKWNYLMFCRVYVVFFVQTFVCVK